MYIGPDLLSPDRVAPRRMVVVSTSVNLPLQHKVQKFPSGTGSPGGPGKRAVKRLWWCGGRVSHIWPDQLRLNVQSTSNVQCRVVYVCLSGGGV